MSNPKRASMREGPLAALFRKTEDDEAAEAGTQAPHPALDATSPQTPAPKDRLKQAFSSEIPANVMDRESARPERAARPVMDEYERHEHPEFPDGPVGQPRIRVVGVGGGGVNAVNRMVEAEVEGVEFLAVNTDQQSLQQSTADITLHIGA